MNNNEKDIDYVLTTVEERDVRFVRLWFTDVLGNLKSFGISPEDLEEAFEEGIGFDGSAVDGFTTIEESDMLCVPDATTFQLLPSQPEKNAVARIFCDITTPKHEPFPGDPRACLHRIMNRAEDRGFAPNVGPILEYFYFENAKSPIPLDEAGYFDLTPYDSSTKLRRDTVLNLEQLSIPVEYSYHAMGPSQHGLSLRYAGASSCADNLISARFCVKAMAIQNDVYASFMPKPFADKPGSALFLQQSLFNLEGKNIFWGPSADDYHLSSVAHSYIAGLLKYAREYMLITNPTVNSYKRLTDSSDAPVRACWGRKNRKALVRVPQHKPGKHQSTRVELRLPDPTCNPYLAIAITISAGLRGIEEGLELPEEYSSGSAVGELLPRNLGEALECFRKSEFVRETLGDHITEYLIAKKEQEWTSFQEAVTDWEIHHYYGGY